MASQIVTCDQFIPSEHLMYTKPRINAVGGKSVGIINKSTRKSLMVQVPRMLTWGVNVYGDEPGKQSYSLSLQFPRDEFSNPETREFLRLLKEMEEKIKTDAVTNCKDWFGKNMSQEVINAFFNPILKYPKDKETGDADLERDPTLKVKLQTWDGEFKFELFDEDNNLLVPNDEGNGPEVFVTKGSQITTILQCGGIWFANGSFGVTWKLYQGAVKPSETLERGQCHIRMAKSQPAASENVVAQDSTVVESDDEEEAPAAEEEQEESQQQEEQEEPVVEEKPKKKRVVKKKST
jgi:hypothetical protein